MNDNEGDGSSKLQKFQLSLQVTEFFCMSAKLDTECMRSMDLYMIYDLVTLGTNLPCPANCVPTLI